MNTLRCVWLPVCLITNVNTFAPMAHDKRVTILASTFFSIVQAMRCVGVQPSYQVLCFLFMASFQRLKFIVLVN